MRNIVVVAIVAISLIAASSSFAQNPSARAKNLEDITKIKSQIKAGKKEATKKSLHAYYDGLAASYGKTPHEFEADMWEKSMADCFSKSFVWYFETKSIQDLSNQAADNPIWLQVLGTEINKICERTPAIVRYFDEHQETVKKRTAELQRGG